MIKQLKKDYGYCDCGKKTDIVETDKEIIFTCENCGKIRTITLCDTY